MTLVLIVDDSEPNRKLERDILRNAGFETLESATGAEALMLARDHAPLAALGVVNEATLVSNRVGCIVLRPVLDLAVACLED